MIATCGSKRKSSYRRRMGGCLQGVLKDLKNTITFHSPKHSLGSSVIYSMMGLIVACTSTHFVIPHFLSPFGRAYACLRSAQFSHEAQSYMLYNPSSVLGTFPCLRVLIYNIRNHAILHHRSDFSTCIYLFCGPYPFR